MAINVAHLDYLEVPDEAINILKPFCQNKEEAVLAFKKLYVLYQEVVAERKGGK
tara:strand:+ start:342 stop:503 length:162 start_codon:yes stop_codon:yes gene_type:complete